MFVEFNIDKAYFSRSWLFMIAQVSESVFILFIFFNHGPPWRHEGWNSLYGHFSRKSGCTRQPEQEQEHAHHHASFGTAAQHLLEKNVSK